MNTSEMKLKSVPANRISLGGIALIVAGIAVLAAILMLLGSSGNPHTEQLQVVLEADTFAYRLALALAPVYMAFFALGTIALYAYLSPTKQEKLAFAGMVVTVLFIALYLPIIGVAAYVFPAIGNLAAQGKEEMIAVMDAAFAEPFIIIPFLGGILWHIGPVLMGAAIWRSGALWKWGGLLLIIDGVLSIPGFVLDMKLLSNVAGMIGGIGQVALGISLFQSVRSRRDTRSVQIEQ
jgi:predicted permease